MLEVKDATIRIGDRVLVTGFSMMANDGQLTCVTGGQGSGKTTLLRTLMGFLPVEKGFVSVDGELLTIHSAPAFRTFMAYLPQEARLLRHQLSPVEAPVCQEEPYGVWDSLLPEVCPEVGPEPLSPEDIFKLEEEMLLGSDKQIVIADEPAASLTPALTIRLLDLLKEQRDKGKTVLIASRNQMLVSRADQVIDLERLLR